MLHHTYKYIGINSPQNPRPRAALLHSGDREKILHMCSCSEANPQNVLLCLASTSFHLWTTALEKLNVNYYERFKVVLSYSLTTQTHTTNNYLCILASCSTKTDSLPAAIVSSVRGLPPSGQCRRSAVHSFHAGWSTCKAVWPNGHGSPHQITWL